MSHRGRRLLLLAALTVALAGVLVAVAWIVREPPTGAVDAPASEPGVTADPEPPPAEPRPWAIADWEAVNDALPPNPGPLFRIDGLIDTGEQFVGWGRVPMPGRNQFNDMGAVFVSADGRSWRVTAIEHGVNAPSTSEIYGVAGGPSGFLAFGTVCCEPEARAFWHSADLVRWTRLALQGDVDPGNVYVNALAGGPDGWVAVGSSRNGTRGAIWASDDGASWDRVLDPEGGPAGMTLADVAMTPDGPIAVGTVTGDDGTYDGAIWTSPDGRTWERVGADDQALVGVGETQLTSVVPHANGVYVAGIHGTTEERRACEAITMAVPRELGPPPLASSCGWGTEHGWLSLDGTTWERVDPLRAPEEHPIEFRLLAAGGPGLVLLGESSGPASPDSTLYTSPDGRTWTAVAPPQPIGDGAALAFAVRGRQVIVVADHFDGEQSHPRVWLATVR